jgi:hypothetical protein
MKSEMKVFEDYVLSNLDNLKDGQEVPMPSVAKLGRHLLTLLSNSYLVKSAALLEGLIWSINSKNAFVTAMCLRQEIEVLAMVQYANISINPSGQDQLDQIAKLLYGSKRETPIPSEDSEAADRFRALNVLTSIGHFDKQEIANFSKPWLMEYYNNLSELVHPNRESNFLNVKDKLHYWKCDYVENRSLLSQFLEYSDKIFSRTIDEIDKIPAKELQGGMKIRRTKSD